MVAITLKKVNKKYRIFYEKNAIIKNVLAWSMRKKIYEDIWALKDISLDVRKGETIGVIGKNGSGKSTLLKILAGVTRQDSGEIHMGGKASALLELGIGFHGELTGRENIYINGSILGLTRKEIDSRFERIARFAEIDKFIEAPIQTYSTGMYLRLGFAVAIHADFDILLIDEILAVGDISYQAKCLEKINEFKRSGKTIVLVSHDLGSVERICDRAVWLNNGIIETCDSAQKVVELYRNQFYDEGEKALVLEQEETQEEVAKGSIKVSDRRWGSREMEIIKVTFLDRDGNEKFLFRTGEPWTVRIGYRAHRAIEKPVFGFGIHRNDGIYITGPNVKARNCVKDFIDEGDGFIDYRVDSFPLLEGMYLFTAAIHNHDFTHTYDYHNQLYKFQVDSNKPEDRYGVIYFPGNWHYPENKKPMGQR